MLKFFSVTVVIGALLVSGCSEVESDIFTPAVSRLKTSYQLAKDYQTKLLPSRMHFTRVQLDVDGDGSNEVFVATQNYNNELHTQQTAPNSTFAFYRIGKNGSVSQERRLLNGDRMGCVHPRKAIASDFNLDGIMDVFVACHGWDDAPFPGERNKLVLSQSDGTFIIRDASSQIGFFHSAAAADFNGDGAPDVIVVGANKGAPIQVWLNDGDGNFEATTKYVPSLLKNRDKNYYTIDLPDVDGDGHFDIFVGGHDWEQQSKTYVFFNSGRNTFSNRSKISIPNVKGDGVVLDVVVTDGLTQRLVWVLRTSGGDGTFYKGATVQKYGVTDKSSQVVYQNRKTKWFSWIFPISNQGKTYIVSDDVSRKAMRISE